MNIASLANDVEFIKLAKLYLYWSVQYIVALNNLSIVSKQMNDYFKKKGITNI